MNTERETLNAEILAALNNPEAPALPPLPGPDAKQQEKDAYAEGVKDRRVFETLHKPVDQINADERAELWREIRACRERGWQ